MRWRGRRQSENVEDRRGMRGPSGPVVMTGGLGTLAIIFIALLLGVDLRTLFGPGGLPQPGVPGAGPTPGASAPDVIAHEIGHHVQNQLGISDEVSRQRGRISQTDYNKLSVRLELLADFLAGVWAHHAQQKFNILEEGDIEEALRAATAIGDDRLQKRSQGYVVPNAFTLGTSEQRVRWFTRGFKSGRPEDGDTSRCQKTGSRAGAGYAEHTNPTRERGIFVTPRRSAHRRRSLARASGWCTQARSTCGGRGRL